MRGETEAQEPPRMNLTIDRTDGVSVVHVHEERLM
jgi:hypothetical protein